MSAEITELQARCERLENAIRRMDDLDKRLVKIERYLTVQLSKMMADEAKRQAR